LEASGVVRSKVGLVALREYHENLRTKTFWIGILAFPVILAIATVVPRLLEGAKDVRTYAVIDRSGWLLPAIEERATYHDTYRILEHVRKQAGKGESGVAALPTVLRPLAAMVTDAENDELESLAKTMAFEGKSKLTPEQAAGIDPKLQTEFLLWMVAHAKSLGIGLDRDRYQRMEVPEGEDPERHLRQMLDDGALFAYFVIGPDPLSAEETHKYVSNNLTDKDLQQWIERLASAEIEARRFEREHIDPEVARRIQQPLSFDEKRVSASGEESEVEKQDTLRQWAPVAFVYLLWVSVFTIAQLLLTNTIEEKSNRIVEVLLSSISPMQLMVGKILGIAATGLTTIGSWIVFFLVFLKFLPKLLDLPAEIDLTVLVSDPVYLASFVAYFLLGFLLYASILVGLGSACNSIKEAQNLMAPVMILLLLPLLSMIPISQDPNGKLAVVLSFIPPFTPFVMMNRAAGPPERWEYAVTSVLLVVSIAVAFWAAAKIFRVGVLMTGKPPRLGELWRWVRTP
jgi:ABC-2 type transport system permease protein